MYIFSQWLRDLAYKNDLLNGKKAAGFINNQQILSVWTEAIQAQMADLDARECYALARQARAADRLLNQWLLESDPQAGGSDWKTFLRWRAGAQQLLQAQNGFTPEDWLQHFCRQLSDGMIAASMLPKCIQLAGFVETTRLEDRVFEALEQAGVALIQKQEIAEQANNFRIKQFSSLEHELDCMAAWSLSELQQGRQRIAVIINGLEGLKETVRRVFEDKFNPSEILGLGDFRDSQFHISHPFTLASHPLVSEALQMLKISVQGLRKAHEFPLISRFLLGTRWHGAGIERFARASLELRIREKGWYRLSLAALGELAAKHRLHASMPVLITRCATLAPANGHESPQQQLLGWLAHWGWPGEQGLDETSNNAVRHLIAGLESIAGGAPLSVKECLVQLQRYCEDTSINLHGGACSPVQIMSPAEAFGQYFDAAWVGNLNDSNWPGRALGNPFIPPALLAEIPRGSDSGMLEYTERLMQSLSGCAREVIFSAAERHADIPYAISPLLTGLEAETDVIEAPARLTVPLSAIAAPQAGEIIDYATHPWLRPQLCTHALALPVSEQQPLSGIVTRFNYQSACPLASYLVFRLHARMESPPGPFADAAFRGTLMHAAMEQLYRPYLGSGAEPKSGDIRTAVEAALQVGYADTILMPAAFAAERIRLEKLLRAWLDLRDFKPGGQPSRLEWQSQLTYAGFEFKLRIDRLDQLQNGQVFIIDYKSGSLEKGSSWCKARLQNIQLPLYAVALEQAGEVSPAGVAMLQLKLGEFDAYGISADPDAVCKGVQLTGGKRGALAKQFSDWSAVMDFWRTSLSLLAAEIQAGDCSHQLHSPDALKYADLELLLRNDELQHWCLEHE